MSFHRFEHSAIAQAAVPPALRPGLLARLNKTAPRWHAYPGVGRRPPMALELLIGVNTALPEARVNAWADLGEWDPGRLWALRVRYSDITTAVLVWCGALEDGYGNRALVVAEVEVHPDGGTLAP